MVDTILVCGGRDYGPDTARMWEILDMLDPRIVIHGDARGADRMAGEWADFHNVRGIAHPANWEAHGRRAGPIRNQEMLDEHPGIDVVVAFPGGRGTADMAFKARQKGIPVLHIDPPGNTGDG